MTESAVTVREFRADDRAAVLALAPRLSEGVAAWRDDAAVQEAVHGWVVGSLEQAAGSDGQVVFVAEVVGEVVGFVTVTTRRHFTGTVDGYVGELVVARSASRRGVGQRLMTRAEAWTRERGLSHLTLETGASSRTARDFYAALGYVEEDIRLTKQV